jgi:hypothetical protein
MTSAVDIADDEISDRFQWEVLWLDTSIQYA